MTESEKLVPTLTYIIACVVLVVLTVLNILISQLDLRGFNTLVGLLIAAAQAIVSAMFFMHLRWTRPTTRLVAMIALLWLAILVVGTMDDVLTRGWLPAPGK